MTRSAGPDDVGVVVDAAGTAVDVVVGTVVVGAVVVGTVVVGTVVVGTVVVGTVVVGAVGTVEMVAAANVAVLAFLVDRGVVGTGVAVGGGVSDLVASADGAGAARWSDRSASRWPEWPAGFSPVGTTFSAAWFSAVDTGEVDATGEEDGVSRVSHITDAVRPGRLSVPVASAAGSARPHAPTSRLSGVAVRPSAASATAMGSLGGVVMVDIVEVASGADVRSPAAASSHDASASVGGQALAAIMIMQASTADTRRGIVGLTPC